MRYIRIQQITDDHNSKYVATVRDEEIVEEFFKLPKIEIDNYVINTLLTNVSTIEDYECKTPIEPLFGFTTEIYEAGVDKYDTLYYSFHTWQDPESEIIEIKEDEQPSKTKKR